MMRFFFLSPFFFLFFFYFSLFTKIFAPLHFVHSLSFNAYPYYYYFLLLLFACFQVFTELQHFPLALQWTWCSMSLSPSSGMGNVSPTLILVYPPPVTVLSEMGICHFMKQAVFLGWWHISVCSLIPLLTFWLLFFSYFSGDTFGWKHASIFSFSIFLFLMPYFIFTNLDNFVSYHFTFYFLLLLESSTQFNLFLKMLLISFFRYPN